MPILKSLCPIYLASSSPRRSDLLREFDIPFTCVESSYEETPMPFFYDHQVHDEISRNKALNAVIPEKNGVVIAADTVGVLDGCVLGKPKDDADAFSMLSKMSGRCHDVITSLTLYDPKRGTLSTSHESTLVYFKNTDDSALREYVASGEPMDKAGSYGIQGKGRFLIDHIDGDYTNVVGLPMFRLLDMLQNLGAIVIY